MTVPIAAASKSISDSDIMSAAKRFGRYKPEEERDVRKGVPASKSPNVAALINAFESMENVYRFAYEEASRLARALDYSADDVFAFTLALIDYSREQFFDVKAGTFISALINCGKDSEYALNLEHLSPISRLGWRNVKHIAIVGDVEKELGAHMECGRIELTGNAGHHTGTRMEGGEIIIHGDVVDHFKGFGRHGMRLDQRTLLPVGINMTGGEIHVFGDLDVEETWKSIKSGRLFHNGALAIDK